MKKLYVLLVILFCAEFMVADEEWCELLPLSIPDKWTLFCPESLDGVELTKLTSIPANLNGAVGKKVCFTDNTYSVDRNLTKSGPAVFMYEFKSEKEGFMQAGAGADWFWSVMINGETVLDLIKKGNQVAPITYRNHSFYMPVKKGRNLVIATVIRGSNGWKFAYGKVPFTVLNNGVLIQDDLGYTDFMVEFPDGKTATQAQSLKNVKIKGRGKNFEMIGSITEGVTLTVKSQEVLSKSKGYAIEMCYTLESSEPFAFDKAAALVHFPSEVIRKMTARIKDNEFVVSDIPSNLGTVKRICVETPMHHVVFSAKNPVLKLSSKDTVILKAEMSSVKGKRKASVSFRIILEAPPYKITKGKTWTEFNLKRTVKKGSIMDFSFIADKHAPAGKLGRIIAGQDGHFVYEKTGERARLIGANLCFTANYVSKKDADALAEVFRCQGYNSVRFHHTDIHMIKGAWNSKNSYEIDSKMLDRLDYLFFAMKRAGMYVTVDFYTMRYFFPGDIAGINKRIGGDIKALLPVSDSAFKAWSQLVLSWMNHVNPYTGIAWKDDPALLSACPLNEDSIISVLRDNTYAMSLYKKCFQEWKINNNIKDHKVIKLTKDPLFARFVIEVKRESNRKIAAFLKKAGINIPLSGSNWWNTQLQTFTRAEFDIVDNHLYADHPFGGNYNQSCCIKGNPGRNVPSFMMPTRIYGKPFTVTEFNYCFPNQYRAEGGAMFGAYSALQDWDAVYRFAWSHGDEKNLKIQPISHFDISSDLISLYTDRQIALLFARGDVSPATRKYLYAVSMAEATKDGFGNMWSRGLFPSTFSALGLISQIGSQPLGNGQKIKGAYTGVYAESRPAAESLGSNRFLPLLGVDKLIKTNELGEIVSDTGELMLNRQKGYLKVVTPKTECMVSFPNNELFGNCLAVSDINTFSSISASAMDGTTLAESKQILLFHLTNVLNSSMKFSNPEMRRIKEIGKLPHLVRNGKATVRLKNVHNNLTVFAVDNTGKRLRQIPASYSNGEYCFKLEISNNDKEAVMAYEIISTNQ